jgi:non-specific protein-tyrosine kinase
MRPETLSPDVRDQLQVIRKHIWWIAAITILAIAVAYALSSQQTKRYTATARVLVESEGTEPPDLATESQRVGSVAVAEEVEDRLDAAIDKGTLLSSLTVRPVTDQGAVIAVTYTTTDPALAAAAANGFANAYIDHLRNTAIEQADEATQDIESIIVSIQQELDQVIVDLERARAAGDITEIGTLESERALLTTRLGALQQRLTDVELSTVNAPSGEIFAPATVPRSPSSPNTLRDLIFAALVGLASGIAIAFLRERLDDSFRDRFLLQRVTGRPVLGSIPRFKRNKKDPSPVLLRDPRGAASEAYRSLRAHVDFVTERDGIKSIMVTSANSGEGKTDVSRNLGVALARSGRRILLVSADLRRPTLEKAFGLEEGRGLSTYLGEGGDIRSFLHKTSVRNLLILPAGPSPVNPSELLGSDQMKDLVSQLEKTFDLVLLDSAPVLPVADSLALATCTQGAILVVEAGRTREIEMRLALDQLDEVEARVFGTVLNRFDVDSSRYGRKGGYQYASIDADFFEDEDGPATALHPLKRAQESSSSSPPPPP